LTISSRMNIKADNSPINEAVFSCFFLRTTM
jgi:hypothetical protein